MSEQNHPGDNGGAPQAPWFVGDDSARAPKTFPFGQDAPEQADPYRQQAAQQDWGAPQNGSQGQPYGSQGQPYGSQGQPYGAQGSQGQPYDQPQAPAQPYQQQDPYQNQAPQQDWGAPQSGSQGQPYGQPQGSQGQAYGSQGQTYGSQGQAYGAQDQGSQGQAFGQPMQQDPYQQAPQQDWGAPQSGSQGQPYGQQQGSQGQPYGSQGQQPYDAQSGPSDPNPYGQDPQQGSEQLTEHNQQFQGILDPHTGEIHPVPDLANLQDTDALLVVVSGPDAGAQILLDTDVVTVGRSPNADIFLDDVTVSRKHAEFVRTPSGFTLRDTGSLNGTYVGRQLIDSIELQNGADVQIGKFRMIFQQRPRTN